MMIKLNDLKTLRQRLPDFLYHLPGAIQNHLSGTIFSKQTFPLLHTDRHEIRPAAAVSVFPQTNGTAVMDVGIKSHHSPVGANLVFALNLCSP